MEEIKTVTSAIEDRQPVPQDVAKLAMEIIGKFEAGGANPWTNVNSTDVISLGFSQWNVNAGSLYGDFFKQLPLAAVDIAGPSIRQDIRGLREAAVEKNRAAFDTRLRGWTKSQQGDPVKGGIRKSLRTALETWLGSNEIIAYQVTLTEPSLRQAYSYARKWSEQAGWGTNDLPRLTAYFFDLQIYNGGRKGLWRQHVTELQKNLKSKAASVQLVTDWLVACQNVSVPNAKHKKMYGRNDAAKNVDLWRELFMNESTSDVGIEMLLFGYLRATISNGDNHPDGFHGIYAADVLNRRGSIALGEGFVHDEKFALFKN